jgi:hypothetical protein
LDPLPKENTEPPEGPGSFEPKDEFTDEFCAWFVPKFMDPNPDPPLPEPALLILLLFAPNWKDDVDGAAGLWPPNAKLVEPEGFAAGALPKAKGAAELVEEADPPNAKLEEDPPDPNANDAAAGAALGTADGAAPNAFSCRKGSDAGADPLCAFIPNENPPGPDAGAEPKEVGPAPNENGDDDGGGFAPAGGAPKLNPKLAERPSAGFGAANADCWGTDADDMEPNEKPEPEDPAGTAALNGADGTPVVLPEGIADAPNENEGAGKETASAFELAEVELDEKGALPKEKLGVDAGESEGFVLAPNANEELDAVEGGPGTSLLPNAKLNPLASSGFADENEAGPPGANEELAGAWMLVWAAGADGAPNENVDFVSGALDAEPCPCPGAAAPKLNVLVAGLADSLAVENENGIETPTPAFPMLVGPCSGLELDSLLFESKLKAEFSSFGGT